MSDGPHGRIKNLRLSRITGDVAIEGGTDNSLPLDRTQWIVAIVILSSFGPYLHPYGIRPDHVAIYGLSGIAMWNAFFCRVNLFRTSLVAFMPFALLVSATWSAIVTWWSPTPANTTLIIAGLDNYLQPVAIYLLLSWTLAHASVSEMRSYLLQVYRLMLLALSLNAALALASVFVDTWPLVRFFVQGEPGHMGTVWERAARLGRYSGIFNQPSEAGIAYSLGLFAWGQLFVVERRLSPYLLTLLFMVLLGGLLTISKVFLMVAIPLFFGWVFLNRNELSLRCKAAHGWLFMGFMAIVLWLLAFHWQGLKRLTKTFGLVEQAGTSGFLSHITGKRFGSERSHVVQGFLDVWENAPLQGFGFGLRQGFDNAYLEFFYQGGGVGLTLYLVVLAWLGILGRRVLAWSRPEGSMLLLIMVFVVMAGVGIPVLTINRSSILLWLLLIFFLELDARQRKIGNS